jgi:5,10-methylenetetrahydrofolate reductase
MLNGPCGGYHKDLCEDPELKCVWIEAFSRLREFGKEKELFKLKLDSMFKIRDYKPPRGRLRDYIYSRNKFFLIYEYVPKKDLNLESFENDLEQIFRYYEGLDIVQNPGGRPLADPLALASIAKKLYSDRKIGIQVTGRDYDRDGVVSHVLAALSVGIDTIVATTGDLKFYEKRSYGVWDLDSPRIIYLIRLINDLGRDYAGRKVYSGKNKILVGASLNPYLDPLEPEIYKIRVKLDAGAHFFVTQPIFNKETLEKLFSHIHRILGIEPQDLDIIVALSPILDEKTLMFLRERSGAEIPEKLIKPLKDNNRKSILENFVSHVTDLLVEVEDLIDNKILYISSYGDLEAGLFIAERLKQIF